MEKENGAPQVVLPKREDGTPHVLIPEKNVPKHTGWGRSKYKAMRRDPKSRFPVGYRYKPVDGPPEGPIFLTEDQIADWQHESFVRCDEPSVQPPGLRPRRRRPKE